ncbi:hypothetical protein TGDOM2_359070 [Toxoplasma gondii GAB2-2007-GAL-DOM2]|uniref:Uncharacterized protein n=4 Tax=Toxoplasma gondii TaxID=5811 RepID=A0A086LGJ5_TOXGO|nr:hypothetical protein TGP89_359070 [Toxoplasma gondii p89]KFG44590.1 hypothetical protein TGDOM2_359070 [Toxoplasma gondii GAB2-2007-GAL-DOM2]KFG55763.1 hypothetical protein TGFOU_359070 [Toxoplasma gondii FOU]KFH02434.1 hypothetical protein TGVAND_310110 [Toxoplasma gondii VAND]
MQLQTAREHRRKTTQGRSHLLFKIEIRWQRRQRRTNGTLSFATHSSFQRLHGLKVHARSDEFWLAQRDAILSSRNESHPRAKRRRSSSTQPEPRLQGERLAGTRRCREKNSRRNG